MTTATKLTACALLIAVAIAIALLASSRAYAQQSCTQVKMIYAEAWNKLYMIDGNGNRLRDIQSGNTLSNRQVDSFIVVRGTPSRIGIEIEYTSGKSYRYRSGVIQSGDRGYEDHIDDDFNDAVILLTSVSCPRSVTPPRQVYSPPPPGGSNPPPANTLPSISSVSADNITKTTARAVVGIADHDGTELTVRLRYQEKAEAQDWPNAHTDTATSSASPATQNLENLTPGTKYVLQASLDAAFPDDGTKEHTFTTEHPPSISAVSVGDIGQTSARATIDIANSDGSSQTVKLQYREKDANPVEEWTARAVQTETSTGATARIDLSGLTENTRYEVQAWLASDETVKVAAEFRTLQAPQRQQSSVSPALPDPSLSDVSIGSITRTSAVATVNIADAGSARKTVYMLLRKFGDTEWSDARPKTTSGASVTYDLTALEPGTTYGVRAYLSTDPDTSRHAVFTTLSPESKPEPSVSGISFGSITQTTAVATVSIADAGSAQKTVHLRYRVDGATTWTTESSQNTRGASKAFSLDGLTAGTTYEVQAWLNRTTPPVGATTYTFDTLPNDPSISDLSFKNIEQTSATAVVEIADAGTGRKEVFLRYSIQGEDDWTTLPNPVVTNGDDASIDLTGLQEQTTYEVAVALSDDFSGTVKKSFTTLPPPSLSGVSISDKTQTGAVATVSISNAGSGQKTALLQYREFGESEWSEAESKTTSGASVSFNLSGLDPGTTYEVKAYLSADPDTPKYVVFATLSPGTSVDDSASVSGISVGSVTQTSAVATVNIAYPGTAQNTVHLHYRKFGESEWVSKASKTAAGASVTFDLSELTPKTKYEVEASLSSDFSHAESATFTTLALDPLISGVRVENIAQTTATAIATIANADGASQTVHTRYRTTTPQGEWSAAQTTDSITSTAEIGLSGLTADTEYEVEASLTDDFGVSRTTTFRTLSSDPVVSRISVSNIAQTTATASIDIANADGEDQTVRLRYRTATHEASWGEVQTATSRTDRASIDLTGLAQGTRYEVQASLDDLFPGTRTVHTTFTTLRYPSIASVEARNVGRNGATIRATIADSHGEAQTVYIRHRQTSNSAWRATHQTDSVNDIASLSLGGLTSETEYIAEASLDDSFPSDETKSVTFTTTEEDTTEDTTKDTPDDDGPSGGSGAVVQAVQASNVPQLGFSPMTLRFTAVEGGDNPSPQTFQVWNRSSGAMNFILSNSEEWLSQEPLSGMSNGPDAPVIITVSVDSSGLATGQYVDVISIDVSSSKASGQINVTLDVLPTDYVRQFVSRTEGGVVILPDGTVKIVVPSLAPPKDVDIELMKVDPEAHGAPPGERKRVVVAIDSNTYPPGGDTPEDIAYSPNVELWIMLPDGESAACTEGKAKVYSVVSGDWRLVEHRCETDESGNVWIVSEIERLGAFALVIDDSPALPTPVAVAVAPTATPTPATTPTTVLTMPQGTAVQRTSLPARAPTPTPTQAPAPPPIPSSKAVAESVSFIPTPTPTAVPSSTQRSMPVLQASTVGQSSGGFDWMMLAALGVPLLIGVFIVFVVYRHRRRDGYQQHPL